MPVIKRTKKNYLRDLSYELYILLIYKRSYTKVTNITDISIRLLYVFFPRQRMSKGKRSKKEAEREREKKGMEKSKRIISDILRIKVVFEWYLFKWGLALLLDGNSVNVAHA